jgi:hypothetical protein
VEENPEAGLMPAVSLDPLTLHLLPTVTPASQRGSGA